VGRIRVLDGLRGACLVLMTVTHLNFNGEFLIGYLHIRQLGFADSAQAFMFLSGLLVGLIGMRQYARGAGTAALARRNAKRALVLYGWHLALLTALLAGTRLLPDAWAAWGPWLLHLFDDERAYAVAAAALLYQPTFLDILPQYVLYLLAAPFVVRLVADGRAGLALALSGGLWVAAQAGLHVAPAAGLERAVVIDGTDVVLRSAFNPLAWQLTFTTGVILGALAERGSLDPGRLFPPGAALLPQLALGLLATFAAVRLAITLGLLDDAGVGRVAAVERRADLGLLPALNFAALAYLVGWLLAAGPAAPDARVRRLGRWARSLFGHPWLVTLGRHGLPVFCYHVLLMYALRYADAALGGVPDPWFSLAGLAAIASLFLVAAALEARRRAAAAPPRAAVGGAG
jgi:hypothetical protein